MAVLGLGQQHLGGSFTAGMIFLGGSFKDEMRLFGWQL